MLLIIVLFCAAVCLSGVQCREIPCQFWGEKYFYEDGLVQANYNRQNNELELYGCFNTSSAPVLDPPEFKPGKMLEGITKLMIGRINWPTFNLSNIINLYLSDMRSIGIWRDCSSLQYLNIRSEETTTNNISYTSISTNWLVNCTRLRKINLSSMRIDEIRRIIASAPSVEYLYLDNVIDIGCLVKSTLFWKGSESSHKNLRGIQFGGLYYSIRIDLCNLNTTWTAISYEVVRQLSLLPRLEYLEFSGKLDFCAPGLPVKFASLLHLKLTVTTTTHLCLKDHRIAPKLVNISLEQVSNFRVQFSQLFSVLAPNLVVHFYNNGQVVNFEFSRDDYMALSDLSNQTIKNGHVELREFRQEVDCDCHSKHWWFSRALRAGLVTANEVRCTDDNAPKDLNCEWMDCNRIYCNSTCICCQEGEGTVMVDCRDAGLTKLSPELLQIPNLSRLIAPNNNISILSDPLPTTLLWVDLSGNNVMQAHGISNIVKLFSEPARRLRLARNNILCSCDNKPLIIVLKNHSHQIEDYENLTCLVTNMKLKDVDVLKICEERDRNAALLKNRDTILIAVATMVVVVAIFLVLALVFYYKRRQIRIFLFARGWCLCCIKEDDLDAHLPYDVFVSFCHEDTAFVMEELLPVLDLKYSVCVHLRDWYPGEPIPTQITMSVEKSRRTLVIMSRKFVRSLWGCLEFQTAHIFGLLEGRVRVVLVILDDILETDDLTAELRSYVRLNTYVRWGDPWFWEKLRYALPHQPAKLSASTCTARENTYCEQQIELEEFD